MLLRKHVHVVYRIFYLLKKKVKQNDLKKRENAFALLETCSGGTYYNYFCGIQIYTSCLMYKSGVNRGTHYTDMLSWLPLHYENTPMQYKEIFKVVKKENFH